jgi:integrase/recombinase XerD
MPSIMGIYTVDVDRGEQLVPVVRKGTGTQQWLPASSEAFVSIRLYVVRASPLRSLTSAV